MLRNHSIRRNWQTLNSSSFPHLFQQCSGLFSPARFNTHVNYIIFSSVHLVTVLWMQQPSNEMLFLICSHVQSRLRFLMASRGCGAPVQSSVVPVPLFGLPRGPLILLFPRIRVKHFFLKGIPAITIFKICTKVTDYSRATYAQVQRTEKKAKMWGAEQCHLSLSFYICIKCLWIIFNFENNYHWMMRSWLYC